VRSRLTSMLSTASNNSFPAILADAQRSADSPRYSYRAYGTAIKSNFRLPLPEQCDHSPAIAEVELLVYEGHGGHELRRAAARVDDIQRVELPDGSIHLRWGTLCEFLVSSDGQRIACRRLAADCEEEFQTYLMGPALSYALLRQGVEQLHSTTVEMDGSAIGLLGDSGHGKSTLAAEFLKHGFRLVTDDVLVLSRCNGGFVVHPGPPRLKLLPESAASVLGSTTPELSGNKAGAKLILPADAATEETSPIRLRAFYAISSPQSQAKRPRVQVRRLSARRAFLQLVRNTYNAILCDPARLERQFQLYAAIADIIPTRSLSYPRSFGVLPQVREAILDDLHRSSHRR
jgi:hypothetical protein